MTVKKLWSPITTKSNINNFIDYISKKEVINTYEDLHKWSVEKKEIFWDKVWEFTNITGEKKGKIFKDSKNFIDTKFFQSLKTNYIVSLRVLILTMTSMLCNCKHAGIEGIFKSIFLVGISITLPSSSIYKW